MSYWDGVVSAENEVQIGCYFDAHQWAVGCLRILKKQAYQGRSIQIPVLVVILTHIF